MFRPCVRLEKLACSHCTCHVGVEMKRCVRCVCPPGAVRIDQMEIYSSWRKEKKRSVWNCTSKYDTSVIVMKIASKEKSSNDPDSETILFVVFSSLLVYCGSPHNLSLVHKSVTEETMIGSREWCWWSDTFGVVTILGACVFDKKKNGEDFWTLWTVKTQKGRINSSSSSRNINRSLTLSSADLDAMMVMFVLGFGDESFMMWLAVRANIYMLGNARWWVMLCYVVYWNMLWCRFIASYILLKF